MGSSAPLRPAIVLCDYGQVLAGFDRSRCADGFARLLGRPLPEEAAPLLEELLHPFESGAIDPTTFLDTLREPLGLRNQAEELSFRKAWGSILWTLEEPIALLRRVKQRPHTVVHIVTNTDPWRLAYASEELGMADLFQQVSASFEDGVTPKGKDSSMWRIARQRATTALGCEPELVLGIDDLPQNMSPAMADGTLTHAHVFTTAAGLEQELLALGLLSAPPL